MIDIYFYLLGATFIGLGGWYVYIIAYHRGWNAGFDRGTRK